MIPAAFTRPGLRAAGFQGFVPFAALRADRFAAVPATGGAYVVLHEDDRAPAFLPRNPAGRFKDKDPTVTQAELDKRCVPGAHVVYIGKGNDLRRRLRQYSAFGAGRPVGHWGGRLIWQIADADRLLVVWFPTEAGESPLDLERDLLHAFCARHGCLPFANRRS